MRARRTPPLNDEEALLPGLEPPPARTVIERGDDAVAAREGPDRLEDPVADTGDDRPHRGQLLDGARTSLGVVDASLITIATIPPV